MSFARRFGPTFNDTPPIHTERCFRQLRVNSRFARHPEQSSRPPVVVAIVTDTREQ